MADDEREDMREKEGRRDEGREAELAPWWWWDCDWAWERRDGVDAWELGRDDEVERSESGERADDSVERTRTKGSTLMRPNRHSLIVAGVAESSRNAKGDEWGRSAAVTDMER